MMGEQDLPAEDVMNQMLFRAAACHVRALSQLPMEITARDAQIAHLDATTRALEVARATWETWKINTMADRGSGVPMPEILPDFEQAANKAGVNPEDL